MKILKVMFRIKKYFDVFSEDQATTQQKWEDKI